VGALPIEHVVAGQRHGIDAIRQLHLEHQMPGVPEGEFRADQIGFPHPTEALVIERADAVAVLLETAPPLPQRLGVMQPKDLNIGDPEPGPLDDGHHLG